MEDLFKVNNTEKFTSVLTEFFEFLRCFEAVCDIFSLGGLKKF